MKWEDDGAWLGECMTRNTGESPSTAVVSRLSQILEETPQEKYYLSAKACQGILRRAERRGKDLPETLKTVLIRQSQEALRQEQTEALAPTEALTSYAVRIRGGCDGGGKGALVQTEKSGTLGTGNDQTIFCLQGNCIDRADTARCNGRGWREDQCYTLNTIDRPAVCAGFKLGNGIKSRSIGYEEERAPTLNAECGGNKPAVLLDMSHENDVIRDCGEICPSLQARMGTGGNQIPLTYQFQSFGEYRAADVASCCKSRDGKDSTDLVCAVDCRNFNESGEVNGTLQAKESVQSLNLNNVVRTQMAVRRLTPLECERLQGFPDGWTDIGDYTDSTGKKRKTSDSARYKALGNSIALPFWAWMLRRMCEISGARTMGSLFDGIGGFPLCWERINGAGSCRWASEIEEFPIAVTKRHFKED